jgi:GntR family transcriptional regulator
VICFRIWEVSGACGSNGFFYASGDPAVHSVDHFPVRLLGKDPQGLDPARSTFQFVERHIGAPLCYSVAEVRPVLPPPAVARNLRIRATQPLLRLWHTHIQADERRSPSLWHTSTTTT